MVVSTYSVILTGLADRSTQKHQPRLVPSGVSEVASAVAFLEALIAKNKNRELVK
jgi:hypothetical protein